MVCGRTSISTGDDGYKAFKDDEGQSHDEIQIHGLPWWREAIGSYHHQPESDWLISARLDLALAADRANPIRKVSSFPPFFASILHQLNSLYLSNQDE